MAEKSTSVSALGRIPYPEALLRLPYPMSNCITECAVALVDPEPDSIDLLCYAIKTRFPRTHISELKSGEALLESLSQARLDAIVTRQKLQGKLNGIALVRALSARGFRGPVIMISNSPELEARALDAGVTEFLTYDRWCELPIRLSALISAAESQARPAETTAQTL